MSTESLVMSDQHVLLILVGQTPAVLTETLWALAKTPPWNGRPLPGMVQILTTREGFAGLQERELIERCPTDDECQWGNKAVKLFEVTRWPGPPTLHCRIPAANEADPLAPEMLLERAERLYAGIWAARSREASVHLSIAGGFNADSHFAGNVMSMLGRPGDYMSQVRVSPEFRDSPDFLHPGQGGSVKVIRDSAGNLLDRGASDSRPASKAHVDLLALPFAVRAGDLPPDLPKLSFGRQLQLLDLSREGKLPRLKLAKPGRAKFCMEFDHLSAGALDGKSECLIIEPDILALLHALVTGLAGMALPKSGNAVDNLKNKNPQLELTKNLSALWAIQIQASAEALQLPAVRALSGQLLINGKTTTRFSELDIGQDVNKGLVAWAGLLSDLPANAEMFVEVVLKFTKALHPAMSKLNSWFAANLGSAAGLYYPSRSSEIRLDPSVFDFSVVVGC